mmetsp:Transcript_7040/g.6180  ORF Transcript_7040/g.6180 Transcript_7040/m.6180 type:complete len:80 (+) Transcript_7040:727-966(+)
MIAASCLNLALRIKDSQVEWPEHLQEVTGLSAEDMKSCAKKVGYDYVKLLNSNRDIHYSSVAYYKFKCEAYGAASEIAP